MSTPDYELRERIERIEDVESSDTDLLTLAVPPDRSLGAVREEIEGVPENGFVVYAGDVDGETVVVSTDFEGGQRFDQAFGGVGAILRSPIE